MQHALLAQLKNPVLPPSIGGGTTGTGGTALGSIISGVIGALFIAGFLLALLTLLMGALSWITAGGDKTKLETARGQITNSIMGIIIVGASYAISTLVAGFFGMSLTTLPIPVIGQ